MAESFKDNVEDAGHQVAEKVEEAGRKAGEAIGKTTEWVKDKAHEAGERIEEAADKLGHKTAAPLSESKGPKGALADIREHMEVFASCGTFVGKVDRVEGGRIKLTKGDSPDGRHHLIPTSWIQAVDTQVHLKKNSEEVRREWQELPSGTRA